MTLSTAPAKQDIKSRIETIVPRVFITEVPPNVPTPAYPYVLLYFGGPIRAGRDHHLTSTRNDTLVSYCTAQVVSATDESATDVADLIRDSLVGFRPSDSGEMVLEMMSYSNATTNPQPTQYTQEIGLSYRTNLQWS